MKTFTTMILAATGLLLAGGSAYAQLTKTIQGETVTMSGTIESIEQATRQVTIKNANGQYETIVAPREMERFSALKVGDKVTARYYDNVVVRLKKPGEAAVDVDTAALTANAQQKAGATASTQRTVTVTITAIDPKVPSMTVTGPNGWVYSRKIADKKALGQVKVGDRLDVTWTDAVLIAVESAK